MSVVGVILEEKKINSLSHSNLQLFPPSPFLENKLGSERFTDIPTEPGVYRFYDAEGKLLYVGKAKNLRRRLFTYKRASPGKTTRKEAALIRRIHRFEYDVLGTEKEALLAENRWIREKRPEFNHQNKHVETYYYIILYLTQSGFGLEYTMKPAVPLLHRIYNSNRLTNLSELDMPILEARIFGCFKGHRSVRVHLGSLLRFIWLVSHGITNPSYLPLNLSRNLTPKRYFFQRESIQQMPSNMLIPGLIDWFSGRSPDLVYGLIQILNSRSTRFQQGYFCTMTKTLFSYFDSTLAPYGSYVEEREILKSRGLIFQDELDDLHVHYKMD